MFQQQQQHTDCILWLGAFGLSNHNLFYLVFNNMGHSRKFKQMHLCADFNAGPTILLVN